ncbi:PREDICTED: protein trichome birefringence-like 14 isoform X2 [Ipomoea nil]|nr:PREDICTED: protein trichome birefringence-like 14 isoform X2 [Ipomoea nil]
MKGGNVVRFWGRQFTLALVALLFTSIVFWYCEKNPLLTSLLSTQDQFIMQSSEFLVVEPADSSLSLKSEEDNTSNEYSNNGITEVTNTENRANDFGGYETNVTDTFLPRRKEENHILASGFQKEACNYAKGKWVPDSKHPLYSGLGCKQWLSDMWACRLTQRTDFSYEGYRWQPEKCEMPDFEGSNFLKRMQDKTIAFIGDSLGRQQFQSLMCMVTGGKGRPEVEDVGWKYGLVTPRGAVRPDGWAFRLPNTNTTILYYWSATLCGIEPLNAADPATEFAMHLDQPPAFLITYLDQFDVVILNTGHHWNRGKINANKWVMHVNGMPVRDRKLAALGNAKNFTAYSIARWFDRQIKFRPQLQVFFRTISPRHFSNGEWNTGGRCENTIPLTKGSEIWQDESSDPVVGGAVKGTNVRILDITAISELRDEAHISHYSLKASVGVNDCLHWCLPGIPDTWNEILAAQL